MHSIEVTKYQWIFRKCITIHFSIRFHCMWWYESRWNTMYYSTIISQDRLELVIINEITWSNLKLHYITGITASFPQNKKTLAPKSITKLRLFVASFWLHIRVVNDSGNGIRFRNQNRNQHLVSWNWNRNQHYVALESESETWYLGNPGIRIGIGIMNNWNWNRSRNQNIRETLESESELESESCTTGIRIVLFMNSWQTSI